MVLAQGPIQTPNTRKTFIKHRTKDAYPKCGFDSCIRVRYRFSGSKCKYEFFPYTLQLHMSDHHS